MINLASWTCRIEVQMYDICCCCYQVASNGIDQCDKSQIIHYIHTHTHHFQSTALFWFLWLQSFDKYVFVLWTDEVKLKRNKRKEKQNIKICYCIHYDVYSFECIQNDGASHASVSAEIWCAVWQDKDDKNQRNDGMITMGLRKTMTQMNWIQSITCIILVHFIFSIQIICVIAVFLCVCVCVCMSVWQKPRFCQETQRHAYSRAYTLFRCADGKTGLLLRLFTCILNVDMNK